MGLSKKITEEKRNRLEQYMLDSIENDKDFNKLEEYDPFRGIGAVYSGKTKSVKIVVATMPSSKYKIVENNNSYTTAFSNNKRQYFWTDYSKIEMLKDQPPMLSWEDKEITYMVFQLNGNSLSKKMQ